MNGLNKIYTITIKGGKKFTVFFDELQENIHILDNETMILSNAVSQNDDCITVASGFKDIESIEVEDYFIKNALDELTERYSRGNLEAEEKILFYQCLQIAL